MSEVRGHMGRAHHCDVKRRPGLWPLADVSTVIRQRESKQPGVAAGIIPPLSGTAPHDLLRLQLCLLPLLLVSLICLHLESLHLGIRGLGSQHAIAGELGSHPKAM